MSEDQKKYDRQIRLWGREGQRLLGTSHVCILGLSSAGTETLKNLVLPGIGKITIVASGKVTPEHCSKSFFFTQEDISKDLSEAALANLLELNPDVKGESFSMTVSEFLEKKPEVLESFGLLVADNLTESETSKVSQAAKKLGVPLVHLRVNGFIGFVRIQVNKHCVYDARPDDLNNLRLNDDFKELKDFALGQFNTPEELLHAPFSVILVRELEEWKSANGGKIPSTFSEKEALKNKIREKGKAIAKELDKDFQKMENFFEALKFAFHIYKPRLTASIQSLFEQEESRSINQNPNPSAFWVIVRAVQEFFSETGHLPTNDEIPDMETKSEIYQRVKAIYSGAAKQDLERVLQIANETILKGKKGLGIEEAKAIVSSIASATVVSTKSFEEVGFSSASPLDVSCSEFDTWKWYLGQLAYDRFHEQKGKLASGPGDSAEFLQLAEELRKKLGIEVPIDSKVIQEL